MSGAALLATLIWGESALVSLAIPATAVAHWLWSRAMRRLPAGVVGAYMFLPPVVATLVGRVWLAEPLPWATAVGGGMILVGVTLVTRQRRPEPLPAPGVPKG